MDIVLALLRTLVFVVATVAAAVYVSRRVARGLPLLWTGATLLVLNWLIDFGWVSYQAGSPDTVEVAGWVVWSSHLLTFVAALAFIWGIGLAAGFGPRAKPDAAAPHGALGTPAAELSAGAGTAVGPTPGPASAPPQQAGWHPTGGTSSPAGAPSSGLPAVGAVAGAGAAGVVSSAAGASGAAASVPAGTHTEPPRRRPRPPGLVVPHAVPVVMTPASHHHSPSRPAAVVDLGPQNPVAPPGGLGHSGVEVRDLHGEAPVVATPTEEDSPAGKTPDRDGPATS